MKQLYIALLFCLFSLSVVARDRKYVAAGRGTTEVLTMNATGRNTLRTTGSDTTWFSNIYASDSLTVFQVASGDSGYFTGTNVYGDQGFAERYVLPTGDSSVAVIGVYALFTGKVNTASTHNATFKIWSQGDAVPLSQTVSYSGFPDQVLDSVVVPFTQLGIGAAADTQKSFYFLPPWVNTGNTFFAGFTLNYDFNSLNGDTIGVQCTHNGVRHTLPYYLTTVISGADTTIDTSIVVQNAAQWSDGNWYDNFTQDDSIYNHLAIYPIVIVGNPNGVKGITKNNLTFQGNMPNPANTFTNVLLSLTQPDNVSVSVLDLSGRTLLTQHWANVAPGPHQLTVDTHTLSNGTYVYMIRTGAGEAFASKLEVVR